MIKIRYDLANPLLKFNALGLNQYILLISLFLAKRRRPELIEVNKFVVPW